MNVGRVLALASLSVVVPACGDGGGESGRFVLFFEDFSAPALDPVWIVAGQGTVVLDGAEGTPPPSLSLSPPNGPALSSLRLTADTSFPATTPLTVSVDFLLNAFPSPVGFGIAGITVFDPAFPSVGASALYDAEAFTIQFEIDGILGPAIADPGGWHVMVFQVDGAGRASWTMDGVLQQAATGFSAINLVLRLRNDSDSVFNFDTILVASP